MRRSHLSVLIGSLAVAGCVGVTDGRRQAPYDSYAGSSRFVSPHDYRRGGDNYLYEQSRRSWQPNPYQRNRAYGEPRYDRETYRNDPRRNAWQGHDNRRDRD
jgi:hypothetical protein